MSCNVHGVHDHRKGRDAILSSSTAHKDEELSASPSSITLFYIAQPTTAEVLRQAQLDILLKDVSRWPGTWAADPSRHDWDGSLPRGNESASADLIGGFAVVRTRQAQSGPWALTHKVSSKIVQSKEGTELLKGPLDLLITMSS